MTTPRRKAIRATYHRALRASASLLLDDVLHRTCLGETEESIALDELPPTYRPRIEADLYRWSVVFAVAGSKLAEPRPLPPACVAEQLAMHAILTFAVSALADGLWAGLPERVDEERAEEWKEQVMDDLFEDTDFLLLYDAALDGIGADPLEPIGRVLGTVNLGYEDWFRPLPGHLGHPYFETPDPEFDEDPCPRF